MRGLGVLLVCTLVIGALANLSDVGVVFQKMDLDMNGDVSYEEWLSAVWHAEHGDTEELIVTRKYFKEFSSFDLSGDGFLQLDELETQFLRLEADHTKPEQVHIAFGENDSEMTIMWVTKYQIATPIVQYGSDCCTSTCSVSSSDPQFPESATGISYTYTAGVFGWSGWIQKVSLSDLQANYTQYCYRVGQTDADNWSPVFSFRTKQPSPSSFPTQINTYGDMGTIMPFGWLVSDQIVSDTELYGPADLFLHAGDLAYAGTGDSREFERVWDLFVNQIQPFAAYSAYMTAVGNHEKYYNFTSFTSRFAMPYKSSGGIEDFYYSFDYGNIHVVSMCTEDYAYSYAPGSPQYAWLQNDLAQANNNRANTPWIVIIGHRPMYSSDESTDSGDLQVDIEPLLHEYSVDLAIWGHMHEYERTYPVYNNTVTNYPTGSPNVFTSPSGTVHLTIGTAGALIFEHWVQPPPSWSAFRAEHYGYGRLTVYNSTSLNFQFMQEHTREVLDQFWINK